MLNLLIKISEKPLEINTATCLVKVIGKCKVKLTRQCCHTHLNQWVPPQMSVCFVVCPFLCTSFVYMSVNRSDANKASKLQALFSFFHWTDEHTSKWMNVIYSWTLKSIVYLFEIFPTFYFSRFLCFLNKQFWQKIKIFICCDNGLKHSTMCHTPILLNNKWKFSYSHFLLL